VAQVLEDTPAPVIVLPTASSMPPETSASAIRTDSLATNSPIVTPTPNQAESSSTINNFGRRHGLSGGQIAGIVIGCVAGGVLLAVGIYYLWAYFNDGDGESSQSANSSTEPVMNSSTEPVVATN
jgi:hypothetical protein